MPIALETITLGLTLARVTLQTSRKIDRIFAEKNAAIKPLVWPSPPRMEVVQSVSELGQLVTDLVQEEEDRRVNGAGQLTDTALTALTAAEAEPDDQNLQTALLNHAPHLLEFETTASATAQAYAGALSEAGLIPEGVDTHMLVFALNAGREERDQSAAWQVGMVVLSAVADFSLSAQETLLRDPRQRAIVSAILTRIATPDLLDTANGRDLLTRIVGATLNGVVDATGDVKADNPWLNGLLQAMQDARARQPEEDRDEYLLRLVQGQGYRQLVAEILEEGSEYLSSGDQGKYSAVFSEVLKSAAGITGASMTASAKAYFETHWPDLLRAGFRAAHSHGPALLDGEDPLLKAVLLAVVGELKDTPDRTFLTGATLEAVTEATIAAVAADPALMTQEWPRLVFASFATIVGDTGLRASFGEAALARFAQEVATRTAASPHLFSGHSEATTGLIHQILTSLAALPRPTAENVARTALTAALDTLAVYPAVLSGGAGATGSGYAKAVSALSAEISRLIRTKGLSAVTGQAILAASVQIVATNPRLFIKTRPELAAEVLAAVDQIVREDPEQLITDEGLKTLVGAALTSLAVHGNSLMVNVAAADELVAVIRPMVRKGLLYAGDQLGRTVDIPMIPLVIARLIEALLVAELQTLDHNEPVFQNHFRKIANEIALAR